MQTLIVFCLILSRALAADTCQTVFECIGRDIRAFPTNITREPLPSIAGTTGAVAAIVWLSSTDNFCREIVRRWRSSTLDAVARIGNTAGDIRFGCALVGAMLTTGALTGSASILTTGRHMLEALAFAGAATTLLKVSIGRARPYRNSGESYFAPFHLDDAVWSFPSGHATVSGALMGVTVARSHSPFVSGTVILVHMSTMFSRVYTDQHWVSDVLVGSLIGFCSGYAFARVPLESSSTFIYPIPNGFGIAVQW